MDGSIDSFLFSGISAEAFFGEPTEAKSERVRRIILIPLNHLHTFPNSLGETAITHITHITHIIHHVERERESRITGSVLYNTGSGETTIAPCIDPFAVLFSRASRIPETTNEKRVSTTEERGLRDNTPLQQHTAFLSRYLFSRVRRSLPGCVSKKSHGEEANNNT